jgi:hypothetical protein
MAKADVLALVNLLSTGLRDSTAADDYYDRIVFEHGLQRESLTGAAYVLGVADQLTYSLPTSAIRVLGIFYDSIWLYREDKRGVERFDPYWRQLPGEPRVFLKDNTDQRQFDVVPRPTRGGTTIGADTPLTADLADNLAVVYTANTADVQPWEELAVAAEILAREFGRDSDHQDLTSAKTWRSLADLLLGLVDNAQNANQPT